MARPFSLLVSPDEKTAKDPRTMERGEVNEHLTRGWRLAAWNDFVDEEARKVSDLLARSDDEDAG